MKEPIDLTKYPFQNLYLGGIVAQNNENPMSKVMKIGLMVGLVALGFTILYISKNNTDED